MHTMKKKILKPITYINAKKMCKDSDTDNRKNTGAVITNPVSVRLG